MNLTEKESILEGVLFAAGDVVSGAKTVVEAVSATKLVADEIEKYILKIK